MKTLFYDKTIEGFLTCVFKNYQLNEINNKISSQNNTQTMFQNEFVKIEKNEETAKRVKIGIIKKTGVNIYNEITTVFCSDNANKENIIFEYIKLLFVFGKQTRLMLNNIAVIKYNELLKKITYERHRMIGFLRFEETEKGLLYAKYSPDNNVTALLLSHFANRLCTENFIIHDVKRNILGIYNKEQNKYFIYNSKNELMPIINSKNETFFQNIWQTYYKNTAIEERKNTKLRNQFMPTRYHKYLTELKRSC